MASIWRKSSKAQSKRKVDPKAEKSSRAPSSMEIAVPTHFRCPISLDLMKDPVIVPTGITYDRHSVETWLDMGNTSCPVTNQPMTGGDLIPNHAIRRMIQDWCVANSSLGIDRIPTPRIPLSKAETIRILSEISSTTQRGDSRRCLPLVVELRDLARESERNRQCILSNGAGRALASSFLAFSWLPGNAAVLEEILATMAVTLPLDGDACAQMASQESSLSSLVTVLRYGNLARRVSAAMVVKEIANPEKGNPDAVADANGLIEALVALVKEPISPRATKSALMAAHYIISSGQLSGATKFVELGMVHVALEILVDAERSTAEKALAVLDGLCRTGAGKREARGNALTVPVLLKRMLRVSETATQFAVSALWSVCREGPDRCLREAVQVGAFQRLLVVLQVGCGEGTKEKVKQLLKLLNGHEGKTECLESFKEIKRAS